MTNIDFLNIKENMDEKIKREYNRELNLWEQKYWIIDTENSLEAAKELADFLHNWTGVIRKNTAKRYAEEHVYAVANLVSEDAKVTAYLHDTFEDTIELYKKNTGTDLRSLVENKFGIGTLRIIESLTEDKGKRREKEKELKLRDFDGNKEKTEKYFEGLKEGEDVEFENKNLKNELKEHMLNLSLEKIEDLKKNGGIDLYKIAAEVRIADIIQNLTDYNQQGVSLKKRNLKKAKKIYEKFKDNNFNVLNILKERIGVLDEAK